MTTRAPSGGASSRGEWEPIKYDDAVFDARSLGVKRVTQLTRGMFVCFFRIQDGKDVVIAYLRLNMNLSIGCWIKHKE